MKQNRLNTLLAAGAVSAIALTTAFAQTSSTTTTTVPSTSTTTTTAPAVTSSSSTTTSTSTIDGTGTITTYTPGSDYISFRTETSAAPVKYYYTKSTTIVDPEGKTVEWSMLKPDMPVRYTYVKEGDRMVISKITLTKPVSYYEKETTTTTTTTKKP
ncbi:MAG TPA: hypothetical protein VM940_15005 [Chthoniobacterales bacterium]|jgi:hypothetical protein|nr:hypothetical protein [Chthoniobacterales bacterium]